MSDRQRIHAWRRRRADERRDFRYAVDFTTVAAIPPIFTGSTYVLSSGHLYNVPTLGSEILGDPGLETAYVSGRCGSLSLTDANANAVLVDETVDVHGGSHAQKFTFGDSVDLLQVNAGAATADVWYQYSAWAKRTAGSNGNSGISLFQSGMLPDSTNAPNADITAASYTLHKLAYYSPNTNTRFARPAFQLSAAGDTCIVDDHSLKAITRSSLYLLADWRITNGTFRVKPGTFVDNTPIGLVLRAGGSSDPTNCIYAWVEKQPRANAVLVYLLKKLSTNTSVVMSVQTATIAAGAWFEAVVSGTSVQLKYNNANVSTPQTITDANLNLDASTYAGCFSAGDNPIDAFAVTA